ncbi:transporter substrate-binding domain-containing protein [Paraburkholderia sp. BCC1886]|uniref:transporter substrate-binding domain-containing protein n=1 Tax=Paraburkholderia sp. BCC1886 TaxID=2562670 RepID=UPI001642BE83|nr:transporter substrate-binding domain-containing protein [Paraburkholderia sp. BCC1886]
MQHWLKRLATAATAALALLTVSGLTHAAQPTSLDQIISQKKIRIGVLDNWPPYSSVNAKGELEGYDVDVARLAGKYLGVDVEFVRLSFPNAVPYLVTNKIDAIFAMLGVSPERAKQIAYSEPYSSIDISLMAAKKTHVVKPEDLKGLRVGVSRGTSAERATLAWAPKDTQYRRFESDTESVQAFVSGQTDTISTSRLLLKQINAANPGLQAEVKVPLRTQFMAVGVRRDDTDLLRWINTFIFYVKDNGELAALHQKWLERPLPAFPSIN